MRHHNLWVPLDENLGPEIFNESVREKLMAYEIVIFSEHIGEEYSINILSQILDRLAHRAGKQ